MKAASVLVASARRDARAPIALALFSAMLAMAGCGGSGSSALPAASSMPAPVAGAPSGTPAVPTPSTAPAPPATPKTRLPDNTAIPPGGAQVGTSGIVSARFQVPLVPIHVVNLFDGRLMLYGATTDGEQGAQLQYALWDPAAGTGDNAFLVIPNTTGDDIFCSTQTLLPGGRVLTAGGDLTFNGVRNFANNAVATFDPASNQLTRNVIGMQSARWYATSVALGDGRIALLGGRNSAPTNLKDPNTVAPEEAAEAPEVFDGQQWTMLAGARSFDAFGASASQNWYYPRAFAAPNGRIFVMNNEGLSFDVDPDAGGAIRQYATLLGTQGSYSYPAVMYAPGKILSARANRKAAVVTLSATGGEPVVAYANDMPRLSSFGQFTILPNGEVLNSNGSSLAEGDRDTVPSNAQSLLDMFIWNPKSGAWRTTGAKQAHFRLYHSNTQLLDDGTLMLSGGGLPGPEANTTAEIYYPPYLYRADGSRAFRPVVTGMPAVATYGQTLVLNIRSEADTAAVNLVRFGGSTHSISTDQRFIALEPVKNADGTVSVTLPMDANSMIPGNYHLFAIDRNGVPSVAANFVVYPR